jgi:hypothetical protein
MWRASMPYGRKGLAVHALSAVDLALWDLLGQLRGESSPRVTRSSSTLILSSSHPRLPAFAIRRRDSPYEAQSGRARTTCNRLGEPVYALLGGRTKVRKTRHVGQLGPTSAFCRCLPTRMHGPTCIFWANLTLVVLAKGARARLLHHCPAQLALGIKVILTSPCIFYW